MEPAYADFTREEFETRWSKARELMVERAFDALLITERASCTIIAVRAAAASLSVPPGS